MPDRPVLLVPVRALRGAGARAADGAPISAAPQPVQIAAPRLHLPRRSNLPGVFQSVRSCDQSSRLLDFEHTNAQCLLQRRYRLEQLPHFAVTLQQQCFQSVEFVWGAALWHRQFSCCPRASTSITRDALTCRLSRRRRKISGNTGGRLVNGVFCA